MSTYKKIEKLFKNAKGFSSFLRFFLPVEGHRKKKLKKKKKKYDISGILHEGPKWIPGKGSPGRWG